MKREKLIPILIFALLLTACNASGGCFSMSTYGECFSTENAVFCVASDEICAYDLKGEKLFSEENRVTEPVYCTSGDYAIVYGEHDLYLSDGKEIRHNIINNKIMSTTVNANGYTAIYTEEAGYKGSVTVFDENFTPLYKWYSASGFIIKASLSEKNTLAVQTANEKGSTVHVFELDSETEQYSVFLEKTLAIDFGWMDEMLCILSENAVYFADGEEIAETVSFDRALGKYALGDELVLIELLNGDGTGELFSYGKSGREKGSAESEMLRNVSVSGGRIAVICGSEAVLYGADLKEITRTDAKGVRAVMLCGGKMLLVRDSEVQIISE